MSEFSWTLPYPSPAAAGDGRRDGSHLWGRDIWLDVAAANGPDRVVTASGDWLLAEGVEAYRQNLIRAFITAPGDWATKPTWGAGARLYVKRQNTRANRDELVERLRAQAMRDRRTESVESIDVSWSNGTLRVHVVVIARGQIQRARRVEISFEV